MFIWVMFGVSADWLNYFNTIDKMDIKIGFEMSLILVEAIRGRCASFMVLTATVRRYLGADKLFYFSRYNAYLWKCCDPLCFTTSG